MSETADWPAWVVVGISLGLAALLLCCVIVAAVQDRRRGEDAVPQPPE
ncbi:MAG TPA: hypothetical protein VH721_00525 [Gaiellaceae bacterium]|jgi:hypothetical protein